MIKPANKKGDQETPESPFLFEKYVRAVHKPGFVPRSAPTANCGATTIHLASMLPSRSSDLPGNSSGPLSSVPLFGLAPGGVCLAPIVTDETGELLPHPFTLT
jgi:hypothetical protein